MSAIDGSRHPELPEVPPTRYARYRLLKPNEIAFSMAMRLLGVLVRVFIDATLV
jgi:hypothetical protein